MRFPLSGKGHLFRAYLGRMSSAAVGAVPVAWLTLLVEATLLHRGKLSWLTSVQVPGPSVLAIALIGTLTGAIAVTAAEAISSRIQLPTSRWLTLGGTVLLTGYGVYWIDKVTHRYLTAVGTRSIAAAWLSVPMLLGILWLMRMLERRVQHRLSAVPRAGTLLIGATIVGSLWLSSMFITERQVLQAASGIGWLPLLGAMITGTIAAACVPQRKAITRASAVAALPVLVLGLMGLRARGAKAQAAISEHSEATRVMSGLAEALLPEGTTAGRVEGAGSCKPGEQQAALSAVGTVTSDAPDILLVMADGVRWDHTSLGGYARDTTPLLAKWAKKGMLFERAYSNSASTRQTFRSLLSGLLPGQLAPSQGINRWALSFAPAQYTVASYLSAAGYQTISIQTANAIDDPSAQEFRGFKIRDFTPARRFTEVGYSANSHIDRVIAQLSEGKAHQPRFVFTHIMETHRPFTSGPHPKHWGFDEADHYDASVSWVDQQLNRIIEFVMSPERRDRTVLIVTSDHGAGLGDRGGLGQHGNSLFDDMTRVPLLFFGNGIRPGRVRSPVSLLDLFPTILDLAELQAVPHVCGESLMPVLNGEEKFQPRPAVSEIFPDETNSHFRISFVSGDYKLIVDAVKEQRQLYNLKDDPEEALDLAESNPPELERTIAEFRKYLEQHARDPNDFGL